MIRALVRLVLLPLRAGVFLLRMILLPLKLVRWPLRLVFGRRHRWRALHS